MNEKRQTMIDLARVSKTFPPDTHALDDVSLRIRQGEMIFLTGQSGAGKTTLLRLRPERQMPGHDEFSPCRAQSDLAQPVSPVLK